MTEASDEHAKLFPFHYLIPFKWNTTYLPVLCKPLTSRPIPGLLGDQSWGGGVIELCFSFPAF